jgi:hypothetical protein
VWWGRGRHVSKSCRKIGELVAHACNPSYSGAEIEMITVLGQLEKKPPSSTKTGHGGACLPSQLWDAVKEGS